MKGGTIEIERIVAGECRLGKGCLLFKGIRMYKVACRVELK